MSRSVYYVLNLAYCNDSLIIQTITGNGAMTQDRKD